MDSTLTNQSTSTNSEPFKPLTEENLKLVSDFVLSQVRKHDVQSDPWGVEQAFVIWDDMIQMTMSHFKCPDHWVRFSILYLMGEGRLEGWQRKLKLPKKDVPTAQRKKSTKGKKKKK